jgi:hypothetical protein
MLAYAWGEAVSARTCLLDEAFSPAQAHALGIVHELAPAEELLDRAVADAERPPEDCLGQYAFTNRVRHASALRDIAELADPLDGELPDRMTSDQARHAHRRYKQLKGSPAPCRGAEAPNPQDQSRPASRSRSDRPRLPMRATNGRLRPPSADARLGRGSRAEGPSAQAPPSPRRSRRQRRPERALVPRPCEERASQE